MVPNIKLKSTKYKLYILTSTRERDMLLPKLLAAVSDSDRNRTKVIEVEKK